MKSSAGKVGVAYLEIQWQCTEKKGETAKYGKDPSALLLSLNLRKKYTPTNPDKAVYFANYGPQFGFCSFTICGSEKMNSENNGYCCVNGKDDHFGVPSDAEGNSPLTGEGKGKADASKRFTCTALETYLINY